MFKNVFVWSLLCGCGGLAVSAVKVSVYYETLCPYSVDFLVNQFNPAYNTVKEKIQIDLIPFGKANITNNAGSWSFTCQHGEAECYGNKVHSCALALYSLELSTGYVVCTMGSGNASLDANLERCATENSISWTTLQGCVSSGQGDELLVANGNRTYAVEPTITGIPTIIFNDVFSRPLLTLARSRFLNVVDFLSEEEECGGCHLNAADKVLSSGRLLLCLTLLVILLQNVKNLI